MLAALFYAVALIGSGLLLFLHVYNLIMFSDLETDFMNPIDLCQRLNVFVLPEFALHAVMSALVLLNVDIVGTLMNAALLAYNYQQYSTDRHWFDPTSIFRDLPRRKWESIGKLAFFLLSFFYYLFRLILSLIH